MNVSIRFYVGYWLKNSLMALATGALLGYFSRVIVLIHFGEFTNVTAGALAGFLLYQPSVYQKFRGRRQGEFEYEFKLSLIDKTFKKLVFRYLGWGKYIQCMSDGLNNISTVQEDLCTQLLKDETSCSIPENTYIIHMKRSFLANKADQPDKEIQALHDALHCMPDDFIANYRLAVNSELKSDADNALRYYEASMNDPAIQSREIKHFISFQIQRVTTSGTMSKPPNLGLRYLSW